MTVLLGVEQVTQRADGPAEHQPGQGTVAAAASIKGQWMGCRMCRMVEAAEKNSFRFKVILAKKKKVPLGRGLSYSLETESLGQTHKLGPSHLFP